MEEAWEFPEGSYLTFQESNEATERAEGRFATVCSLPLKLVLTKIGEGGDGSSGEISETIVNSKLCSTLAPILKFLCGIYIPCSVASWRRTNRVEQLQSHHSQTWTQCTPHNVVYQVELDRFSYWNRFTSCYKPHMRRASRQGMDFNSQLDVMVIVSTEKEGIIDSLTREIVRYNEQCQHNRWSCNCQRFVWDMMKTIRVFGIELANISRVLKEYFSTLYVYNRIIYPLQCYMSYFPKFFTSWAITCLSLSSHFVFC